MRMSISWIRVLGPSLHALSTPLHPRPGQSNGARAKGVAVDNHNNRQWGENCSAQVG